MSVIAKMHVGSCGQCPNGSLIKMDCVYDADLSTASNEDVRFTKASPWGEAMFESREVMAQGSAWYLFFDEEPPAIESQGYALKVRCNVVHDYGSSKQVEVTTAYNQDGVAEGRRLSTSKHPSFHLKMTIDNPGASIQFKPEHEYFLTLLPAARFTNMEEAITHARGGA